MRETVTPIILGIESSCDETSASLCKGFRILSNEVSTQEIHKNFGGVIPELASRFHQKNIVYIIQKALSSAKISKDQLNAVSFTIGIGLIGSLFVGASFAKSLALTLNIPLIGVHHVRAHILAHFIEGVHYTPPDFPFLCLTISGGHTKIVLVKNFFKINLLGQSVDDSVGETFDKVAKLWGFPYPGGPLIDKYAIGGNPNRFSFSKPKINGLNFSFSGLKTHILFFTKKQLNIDSMFIKKNLPDLCASFQKVICDLLIEKIENAVLITKIHKVAIAGGVSENSEFRKRFFHISFQKGWESYLLPKEYTLDNAAMIALVGFLSYRKKKFSHFSMGPKK
ncbi:MAG TPA: tRNA (adenosine(37)-N6)-threonylcarbamoyltransferase complex transferase subunit TsaD [Blattabacteriaceae bacterium]